MYRSRLSKSITYVLLLAMCAVFCVPFAWALLCSLKTKSQVYAVPPKWDPGLSAHANLSAISRAVFPSPVAWGNYLEVFRRLDFALFFRNSFFICLLATAGQLLSSSVVAFGFARIRFAGRDALFLLVLATMMIPYQVTMIPLFLLFREIGWVDSFLPLIVPQFFGSAFNIFLLRQFFRTVPYELDEAAAIDGCGRFGVYWRIILPISKPALMVVAIFTFLWHWRDLMGPLIYLDSLSKRTVALGIAYFRNPYETGMHLIMAAAIAALVPVVALFFVGQRYILQGITLAGVRK